MVCATVSEAIDKECVRCDVCGKGEESEWERERAGQLMGASFGLVLHLPPA